MAKIPILGYCCKLIRLNKRMNMKYLSILTILFWLISCQNTSSVVEEMADYCNCISNPESKIVECKKLRNDIIKKYEFVPEAIEIIQMKSSECVQN